MVALAAFAGAAATRPGYDHVADTISKLNAQGVSRSWLWTGGLLVYAVLMALGAAGFRRKFGFVGSGRWLWAATALHAVLMIGVAVFRDDLRPGGFFSWEGALHDILSGMAFSALVVAMAGVVGLARIDRNLRSLRAITLIVGSMMSAVGVAFLFTPTDVQGVPQRIFVGLAATWIIVFSGRILAWRRTHPTGPLDVQ